MLTTLVFAPIPSQAVFYNENAKCGDVERSRAEPALTLCFDNENYFTAWLVGL